QSSSQRRQIFLDIQSAAKVKRPLHLLKDMPVRWSSTKNMVKRAVDKRVHIAQLIRELERAEKDLKKRDALGELHISDEEWVQLQLLLDLLELPDCAQQAFSAEKYSTLYNAVPALLSLLHAWEARSSDIKYHTVWKTLEPALDKLRDYVRDIQRRTNDVYHMAMGAYPCLQSCILSLQYLSLNLAFTWLIVVQFRERYAELNSKSSTAVTSEKPKVGALRSLLAELRPANTAPTAAAAPPTELWRVEYESYIRSDHDVPDGMPLVQWWGMNSSRYPTWTSLSGDYLPAMASSVSSERIFSSAGITITKRRNRLQGDIVEATQVLKAAIRNDLLVRKPQPSSTLE
ncbi:hypothetical protein EXIGLDRAFT_588557, partial [Exidia glandulosa HHB12029]